MSEELAAVATACFSAIDAGDWPGFRALLHDDHAFHFPFEPQALGADAHVGMTGGFSQAFSEFTHHIEEQFVAGDRVVTRGTITAKHTGEYNGMPPTGNDVGFGFINIIQVVDGKNREEWVELNGVQLLAGIGAMPG